MHSFLPFKHSRLRVYMPLFAALLLVLTPGMGAADPAPASPVPEVSTATPSVVQEALQAVVEQTIGGLACGNPIRGKVAFLGGPLHFLPELRKRFIATLKLAPEEVVPFPNAQYMVALGTALSLVDLPGAARMADMEPVTLGTLAERARVRGDAGDRTASLPPLFDNEADYDLFRERHNRDAAPRKPLESASGPLFLGVDEEGGTVVRVSSNPHLRASKFPSPQKAYASGGMEAVLADTREKDLLLSALGFNVNLSPVADVSTNPADFMYDRTFGQDAAATADYVAQVVSQMAEDGMGSVLKHFPGYGNNVDTHTGIAVDQRPLESFTSSDFLPFQAGMESGGGKTAVLVSHNIMTAVDGDLPASLSPKVHGLLRTDLGFDGVVMTDDLAMEAVAAYSADGAVAVMALEAGNDLVITTDYRTQIPKVLEALESGALSEETIDTACRRVLTWKQNLGLL
mgnify:CR=1 FL=1